MSEAAESPQAPPAPQAPASPYVWSVETHEDQDRWTLSVPTNTYNDRHYLEYQKEHGQHPPWAGEDPALLRHSFVSILSAEGVRIEDISDLVGHSGTAVIETVYRHEIRPALTTGATP